MRRVLSGVVGAALLLSMVPVVAGAAAQAPFAGTWTSIDVFDGSTQYLSIDKSARPTVTLVDLYASYCANHGALSTLYVGSGAGKFKNSTELDVTLHSAACGSFKVPLNHSNAGIKFTLQTDGTLLDTYGDIWHPYA